MEHAEQPRFDAPSPSQFIRNKYSRNNSIAADSANLLLLPSIVTGFLWSMSVQQISELQAACAWLLLCFPWSAYLSWRRRRRYEVSLFAFVTAMYWLYFGVALFLGNRRIMSIAGGTLSDEPITQAMIMAVTGVACLWAGMRTPIGRGFLPNREPDIPADPSRWNYIRAILMFGTLFSLFPGAAYILGEAGRQLIIGLQDTVPLVAFIILFRLYLKGNATQLDKVLLAAFFLSKFAVGVSGGWLGSIVFVVLACFVIYLSENRRPPWLAMSPLLIYIVFFQAGKAEFRSETWYGGGDSEQSGIIDRVGRWSSLSLNVWQEALDDPSGEKRAALLTDVVMRTSLLTQTAYVTEQTPSQVPYQLGGTYSYLAATWIPRVFWPDKPSASEANRFYQVVYGLTTAENLENVAIAVGAMTEGYINFGWLGVAGVMFSLGLLFNWVQHVFLVRDAGRLFGAIGVMLVTRLIGIEAQMAIYVGGVVQQVVLVFIVFAPALHWRQIQARRQDSLHKMAPNSLHAQG